MLVPFSALTARVYTVGVKPILFRRKPDIVHERMIKASRFVGKVAPLRWLTRLVYRHDDKRLSQNFYGTTFPNPVGLAAGLDKNAEMVAVLPAIGFGFGTIGSVTHQPCAGNPRPWFYRLPNHKSLVVNAGLANEGVEKIQKRLTKYKAALVRGFPLVVSVAKTNIPENCTDDEAIADYLGSLVKLKDEPRVGILEINISCPNAYGGEPFTDPKRLETLLSAVDTLKITKPIWVKMPINHSWPDFDALLKVVLKHNIQGVTIGNLSKERSIIPSEELPNEVKGNLSGLPTQTLSDELIGQTYQSYGDRLTIIGVGGIFTAEDAYRKIRLGASLVELITGVIYEGPQLIGQINRQLANQLSKDGFSNISSAIGSAHRQNI
ncbi:quinone-dependent dihydroorotate dehydrogenase [Candidatus Saccharibacteria bacterium]|nr:MAG: quinone-dependent dihydroorotate dehydrogenase [Candidatus Saccharibacteria bacterium]